MPFPGRGRFSRPGGRGSQQLICRLVHSTPIFSLSAARKERKWAVDGPRRRKVHSTPFPPDGENYVRSLAPPLPTADASPVCGGGLVWTPGRARTASGFTNVFRPRRGTDGSFLNEESAFFSSRCRLPWHSLRCIRLFVGPDSLVRPFPGLGGFAISPENCPTDPSLSGGPRERHGRR